jgi:DtxR family manganese transport transcriptional regulator
MAAWAAPISRCCLVRGDPAPEARGAGRGAPAGRAGDPIGYRSAVSPTPNQSAPPRRRAEPTARHRQVRADHAEELAEDYVEAILDLIEREEPPRVSALATRFGVTHVTVIRTLARLAKSGLVQTARNAPVVLTPAGRRLATRARRRHEIVWRFLVALGLDAATADREAEGIEHHVGARTLRLMDRFAQQPGTGRRSKR